MVHIYHTYHIYFVVVAVVCGKSCGKRCAKVAPFASFHCITPSRVNERYAPLTWRARWRAITKGDNTNDIGKTHERRKKGDISPRRIPVRTMRQHEVPANPSLRTPLKRRLKQSAQPHNAMFGLPRIGAWNKPAGLAGRDARDNKSSDSRIPCGHVRAGLESV